MQHRCQTIRALFDETIIEAKARIVDHDRRVQSLLVRRGDKPGCALRLGEVAWLHGDVHPVLFPQARRELLRGRSAACGQNHVVAALRQVFRERNTEPTRVSGYQRNLSSHVTSP